PRRPGRQAMDAREIAVAPQAGEVHPLAARGLHVARQAIERPEVVVRVNGRDRVERRLDAAVRSRLPRPLPPGQVGREHADDPSPSPKPAQTYPHGATPQATPKNRPVARSYQED